MSNFDEPLRFRMKDEASSGRSWRKTTTMKNRENWNRLFNTFCSTFRSEIEVPLADLHCTAQAELQLLLLLIRKNICCAPKKTKTTSLKTGEFQQRGNIAWLLSVAVHQWTRMNHVQLELQLRLSLLGFWLELGHDMRAKKLCPAYVSVSAN